MATCPDDSFLRLLRDIVPFYGSMTLGPYEFQLSIHLNLSMDIPWLGFRILLYFLVAGALSPWKLYSSVLQDIFVFGDHI